MQIVANELILGGIAGLGCLVGGTLLLPSLATDELREVLADVIQGCGMSISGYASRIFPPEQVHTPRGHENFLLFGCWIMSHPGIITWEQCKNALAEAMLRHARQML